MNSSRLARLLQIQIRVQTEPRRYRDLIGTPQHVGTLID